MFDLIGQYMSWISEMFFEGSFEAFGTLYLIMIVVLTPLCVIAWMRDWSVVRDTFDDDEIVYYIGLCLVFVFALPWAVIPLMLFFWWLVLIVGGLAVGTWALIRGLDKETGRNRY